jgi:hypothetical protein
VPRLELAEAERVSLRSVRVGRLAGIPIGVQPLWLLIVALIARSLGAVYCPDQAPGAPPAAAYALGRLDLLSITDVNRTLRALELSGKV